MDVSAIASVATEMSQVQTAQAVQLAVLKKAMAIEEQSAMQFLLQATSAQAIHRTSATTSTYLGLTHRTGQCCSPSLPPSPVPEPTF
jgi:hypothetical protein